MNFQKDFISCCLLPDTKLVEIKTLKSSGLCTGFTFSGIIVKPEHNQNILHQTRMLTIIVNSFSFN